MSKGKKNGLVKRGDRIKLDGKAKELLVIRDLGEPTYRTLKGEALAKVLNNIDPRYQRTEIKGHVDDMIRVLKSGGAFAADPVLSERPDGSLWIVDGQQRIRAHFHCDLPIRVKVFKISDWRKEAKLFFALSNNVKISAATIVHGWTGPIGTIIRDLENTEAYAGKINHGTCPGRLYDNTSLVYGVCALLNGQLVHGKIQRILTVTDRALNKITPEGRLKIQEFFNLVREVFPDQRARSLPVMSLGLVAARRWKKVVKYPDKKTIHSIRYIDWKKASPTYSSIYAPTVTAEIEKRWK